MAALDGGKYGLTFASGLGATTSLVGLLSKGDHIISSDDVYGGTNRLFRYLGLFILFFFVNISIFQSHCVVGIMF